MKTHRQAIGGDGLGKFAPGKWGVIGRDRLEDVAGLIAFERVDPREEYLAFAKELAELILGPNVILMCADNAFHLVGGPEVGDVFGKVTIALAAAGAFEIDDPMDSRVHGADVMRAAGFQKYGEPAIAQGGE